MSPCWKKANLKKRKPPKEQDKDNEAKQDETGALLIGVITQVAPDKKMRKAFQKNMSRKKRAGVAKKDRNETVVSVINGLTQDVPSKKKGNGRRKLDTMHIPIDHPSQNDQNAPEVGATTIQSKHHVLLDHHIFDSDACWKRAESMRHPTLRLRLSTNKED